MQMLDHASDLPVQNLKTCIKAALAMEGSEFIETINCFTREELHFQKKYFGILKGLAVIEKENYVPPKEFQKGVELQARNLMLTKAPVAACEEASRMKELFCSPAMNPNQLLSPGHCTTQ